MTTALLEHGANPFVQDNVGRLPIYRAILNGNQDVVEVLLAKMESMGKPSLYRPLVGEQHTCVNTTDNNA